MTNKKTKKNWFKRPPNWVDPKKIKPEYDEKLQHNEVLINGQKRKLSKSSQYFLDMLTIEDE